MNLLAHAYLSFNQPEILVGNMISDFVKGKKQFDYEDGIQKGIRLHRDIDTFTDAHEATKKAAALLKPAAGAYAGAFVDVVYDHFLANDTQQFADDVALQLFAKNTYESLFEFVEILPERFDAMLPYMQSQNWLYNYKHFIGIENSFAGLVRRAKYIDSSTETFVLFRKNYLGLQQCYNDFFPELKAFVLEKSTML